MEGGDVRNLMAVFFVTFFVTANWLEIRNGQLLGSCVSDQWFHICHFILKVVVCNRSSCPHFFMLGKT